MDYLNFTYAPIALPLTEELLKNFAQEILAAEESAWYWSSYRQCKLLPLYTGGGEHLEKDMSKHHLSFAWTQPAESMVQVKKWIEEHLFSWMNPRPRITVLRTPPKAEILPHIDCSEKEFQSLQHKLRIVCQGPRDSLYFIGEDGQEHYVSQKHSAYIIDGSHCHGMRNGSHQEKITLCFGNPWNGQADDHYQKLLQNSIKEFSTEILSRTQIGHPFLLDWFKK